MSRTYTIGVEFIETDERCGNKPDRRALTWTGEGDSEQDAIERCCEWFGFEEDGIEVTDIRVLGNEPPEDEDAPAASREAVAAAKKAPAKKKPTFKAAKPAPDPVPAPAKKKTAQKTAPAVATAAETTTIALPGGVELAMVRIPGKDYWMGKFQVTQAQWKAVTGENPSEFEGSENPLENVSWDACQAFLKTLNGLDVVQKSGLVFRLPEEAEWETACRAGATGKYYKLADGTEITEETLGEVAWFDENSDDKTHPVGRKQPNAFGLYDMHGNVCEWTATAVGGNRVLRGGSWNRSAWYCKSSLRIWYSPSYRSYYLGFRLCASGRAD